MSKKMSTTFKKPTETFQTGIPAGRTKNQLAEPASKESKIPVKPPPPAKRLLPRVASEDNATMDNAAEDFAMVEDQYEAPAEDTEHKDPAMVGGYKVPTTGEGIHQSSTMGGVPSKSPDERASKTAPDEGEASKAPDEFDNNTPDDMRGIGSSKSCHQQAAAVSQETGGWA
jgi:hypothetical protein